MVETPEEIKRNLAGRWDFIKYDLKKTRNKTWSADAPG